MPLILADRVNETSQIIGTGTVTLDGAVTGYQSFAAIGNGNTTYYTIAHQTLTEWEVGIGTYTASGTTLARSVVLASSNSGSLVNFSAGTKNVFCDLPAYAANRPILESLNTIADDYTLTTGRNGVSVGPVTLAPGADVTVPSGQTWLLLGSTTGSGAGTIATVGKAIAMAIVFGG
jgi:hypothetical protein